MLLALLMVLGGAPAVTPAQKVSTETPDPEMPSRVYRPERIQRVGGRTGRFVPGQTTFNFATASGAGMGAACACTSPTTVEGLSIIGKRIGPADCIKVSDYTNITPGSLVTCADSQPLVMPGNGGGTQLGLFVWPQFVQDALQTDDLANVAWTSTEAVTSNTTLAPDNTLTADTLNDTNAGVQSCTSQTIVTTSQTVHGVSAYVRAGTIAKATLKMVGAGNSAGDCTATSTTLGTGYTWMNCKGSAAYGAGLSAVVVSVCVGTAASDVGTVIAWRVNHSNTLDAQGVPPSIAATTGAVTRGADLNYFRFTPTGITTGSLAFTVITTGAATNNTGLISLEAGNAFKQSVIALPGSTPNAYVGGVNEISGTMAAGGTFNVSNAWSGVNTQLTVNGTTTTGPAGTPAPTDFVRIGNYSDSFANVHGGVYKNIVITTAQNGVRVGWPGDSESEFVPGKWMGLTGKFAANWSVSGSVISQCIQQWRTYRTSSDTRVLFWCGVNDILNGQTGANAWAAYLAACDEIAAAIGTRPVMVNIQPFGTYSGYTAAKDTERLAFNSLMSTYCTNNAATQKCVDMNTALWDTSNHTNQNPAYTIDGLHLNSTGQTAAATAIQGQLP